jgi:DNA-directed RNA polymerase alpha subunit
MSIAAMKQALEALEDVQEAYGTNSKWFNERVDALRAAIEQAEQDTKTPLKVLDLTVRVECLLRRGRVYDVETLKAMDVRHLLAIPDFGKKALKEVSEALLKYELVTERRLMRKQRDQKTKKQEPLTDEQLTDMYTSTKGMNFYLNFARAIEAAHGIKE